MSATRDIEAAFLEDANAMSCITEHVCDGETADTWADASVPVRYPGIERSPPPTMRKSRVSVALRVTVGIRREGTLDGTAESM